MALDCSRKLVVRSTVLALLAAGLTGVAAAPAAAKPQPVTSVTMVSESGDYVGQGARTCSRRTTVGCSSTAHRSS